MRLLVFFLFLSVQSFAQVDFSFKIKKSDIFINDRYYTIHGELSIIKKDSSIQIGSQKYEIKSVRQYGCSYYYEVRDRIIIVRLDSLTVEEMKQEKIIAIYKQ